VGKLFTPNLVIRAFSAVQSTFATRIFSLGDEWNAMAMESYAGLKF
jgi:hypothetical protein